MIALTRGRGMRTAVVGRRRTPQGLRQADSSPVTPGFDYCSTFFISALPCVDDAQFIKQSRPAVLLANDTTVMKPIEFHTAINFDFKRKLWFENDLFGSKPVAEDRWEIDKPYRKKYPVLRDSLGI